jgi:hypothetical protein
MQGFDKLSPNGMGDFRPRVLSVPSFLRAFAPPRDRVDSTDIEQERGISSLRGPVRRNSPPVFWLEAVQRGTRTG